MDNIDYVAAKQRLIIASPKVGTLTIALVARDGALSVERVATTTIGARNAMVDAKGVAYVPDSAGGQLVVIGPSSP